MKTIVEVDHLSKKYKYGESQQYYTLRDALTGFVKNPFQLFNKDQSQNALDKGEFWALKDISFSVNQGDVIGIIGPNGSGKSTLLKILSRITPPTSGEVVLRGRVGSLLEVGTGFQQELTGRENIYLNGAILGMKKREINRKFDEIVDFSGVEKFLDTPVKHYSSGMYMRLAFAVAANLDSEILIIDEVLAVGDAEFQKKCLGKMDEVAKKEGRTVLFVSHNMEAVKKLCNHCILLDKGKKIFEGGVEDAYAKYTNLQRNGELIINKGVYNSNRRGSGTLSFTSIEILDINDKKRNVFNINETVRFKVSYTIFEEIHGLCVSVCLFSSKISGLLLTSIQYEIKNGTLKKGEKGVAIVEVKLSAIRPGEYVLYFWLGDEAAKYQGVPVNYDVVEDLTKPLIIEAKNEDEKKLGGIFSLPSKIKFE